MLRKPDGMLYAAVLSAPAKKRLLSDFPHDIINRIRFRGEKTDDRGDPEDYLSVPAQLHGTPYARFESRDRERGCLPRLLSAR